MRRADQICHRQWLARQRVTAFVPVPLPGNGKIDRKALPAPQELAPVTDDRRAVLMTPTEQRVATATRELLATVRVGLQDNFFDLRGQSLVIVKFQARLQQVFSIELPLLELVQWTTVPSQAERIQSTGVGTEDAAMQWTISRHRTRPGRAR